MKRLFASIAAVMLLLTACSSNTGTSTAGTANAGQAATGSTAPVSEPGEAIPTATQPAPGILSAGLYDQLVQVGEELVQLPIDYASLPAGVENVDDSRSDGYLVDAGSYAIVKLAYAGSQFSAYVYNDSDDLQALSLGVVRGIVSDNEDSLYFAGGIHIGSTLDELKAVWGEPDSDDSSYSALKYKYCEYPVHTSDFNLLSFGGGSLISATGNQYTVTVDRDTARVTNITFQTIEQDMDTLLAETKEYTGTSVLRLTYEFPATMFRNSITLGGRRLGVIHAGGEDFVVTIDPPTFVTTMENEEVLSEDGFEAEINLYLTDTYDVKVLELNGFEGVAVGYRRDEESLKACAHVIRETYSFNVYDAVIVPADANGKLTDAGIDAFMEMYEQWVLGISGSY